MYNFNQVITDLTDLGRHYSIRDGFIFTSVTEPANVFDGIVIRAPDNCDCESPKTGISEHSLAEHIEFIEQNKIEKALIITEDLSFITRCPSLKYLQIIPADTAKHGFDYSPLYHMPEIKELHCTTIYGRKKEKSTTIDYSQVKGLENLSVSGEGHLNFEKVESLKRISISNIKTIKNLKELACDKNLKDITIMQCGIETLQGIEAFEKLESICLWYNRTLSDISQLSSGSQSIQILDIENCSKLVDFSVLEKMSELWALRLYGKNELQSLKFLEKLKKLKIFTFSMNVQDGDLNPCTKIPYASCRNRKHYNLKDKDLPKEKLY